MNKRGQVTIFIIIAILIIGIIAMFIILNNKRDSDNIDRYFTTGDIKPKFDLLRNSIYNCMQTVGTDAIYVIWLQGGYYYKPREALDLEYIFIPYYYKQGQILIPTKTEIGRQISMYVNNYLGDCFKEIDNSDFSMEYQKANTVVAINPGEVKFIIDMQVDISKNNKKAILQLKKSPFSVKSKLYEMYEVAKFITDSHKEDAEMLCISCVANMAKERDLYVDMIDQEENSSLVTIYDNSTSSDVFIYEFLNKY